MERIGESVGKELARSGGDAGLALAEITAVWPQAVGEAVARQAWPLRMGRDGTLHVATASSTWAFELDRLSVEIMDRLAALAEASAPARLRFRVGPIPEPGAPLEQVPDLSNDALEMTAGTESEAAAAASEIEDPALRAIVARAARAGLARTRSGRQI
jgi:hypothetical protein